MARGGVIFAFVVAGLLLVSAQEATEEASPAPEEPAPSTDEPKPKEKPKDTGKDGKSRKELAEGKPYCEYDNCYELLGVEPTSGPIPIKRAYRRLAAEWHPDKCPGGDVEKCREEFPKYANAYEILSNSEMRKNYDYVLANPYEFPGFYMKYSKPKYAPKSDLRFVFVLTLVAAAGVQFMIKRSTYDQALSAMKKDPRARYNERLKEVMTRLDKASPKKGAGSTKNNKTTVKPEELEKKKKAAEEVLAAESAAELPPPPSMADNVAVSLFKAPLTITYAAMWVMQGGLREPGYMTRKALGMGAEEWAEVDEEEQAELIGKELWVAENLEAYEEAIAESERSGKANKTGKEKRAERARKKAKANPSAAVIEE